MADSFDYFKENHRTLAEMGVSRYCILQGEVDAFCYKTMPLLPGQRFEQVRKALVDGVLMLNGITIGVGQLERVGRAPHRPFRAGGSHAT